MRKAPGTNAKFLKANPERASISAGKPTDDKDTLDVWCRAPELDPHSGLWRFDFGLDPRGAYFPFVQLAVGRYQPNAIKGLELSRPNLFWTQIPPRRDLQLVHDGHSKISVKYWGPGFSQGPVGGDATATVRLRPMKAVPSNDQAGEIIRWLPLGPEVLVTGKNVNGVHTWEGSVQISTVVNEWGVLVEEFERMEGDVDDSNGVPTTQLVTRAPFFSRIFDLCSLG